MKFLMKNSLGSRQQTKPTNDNNKKKKKNRKQEQNQNTKSRGQNNNTNYDYDDDDDEDLTSINSNFSSLDDDDDNDDDINPFLKPEPNGKLASKSTATATTSKPSPSSSSSSSSSTPSPATSSSSSSTSTSGSNTVIIKKTNLNKVPIQKLNISPKFNEAELQQKQRQQQETTKKVLDKFMSLSKTKANASDVNNNEKIFQNSSMNNSHINNMSSSTVSTATTMKNYTHNSSSNNKVSPMENSFSNHESSGYSLRQKSSHINNNNHHHHNHHNSSHSRNHKHRHQRGKNGSNKNFQILWKNISYTVKVRDKDSFWKSKIRRILNNLSGCFSSGEVAAIMGPSGAGKSTFLEILACRKQEGLSGWYKVKNINKIRIAYVPQNNYLMDKLTVFETLRYACRLNYSTESHVNYNVVEKLIKQFGLTNIRDTRLQRCSGGQQKRVSIALELFSRPNLLILDEPTTGLDSSSCALVVKILKELVKNPKYPMAILATIHQPSWSVFTEFHNVYIINRRGENLFLGSPRKLLPLMEKIHLPCDRYTSPPDYIIEIAAEDYGLKPIKMIQNEFQGLAYDDRDIDHLLSMEDARVIRKTPLLKSILILLNRSALIFKRDLAVTTLRLLGIMMLSLFLSITFGHNIGHASGCPLHKHQLYTVPLNKLSSLFEEEILTVMQNNCCLFFGLIVGLISGMTSTVLEFPREMHILMKEYNNGWYSCISFYIAKTIMDIPMQVIIPAIYIVYVYDYTGQPKQYYREGYLLALTILVGFASESMGAAISAIFMREPATAAFVSGAIPMPMVLFGGFLVKYSRMPYQMQLASWFSLLKYAFEGLIVAIYGFDRCQYNYELFVNSHNISTIEKPTWADFLPLMMNTLNPDTDSIDNNNSSDHQTSSSELDITAGFDEDEIAIYQLYQSAYKAVGDKDKAVKFSFDRSIIFNYYGIEDDYVLYRSLIIMVLYVFIIKFITYFVIIRKLKKG